MDVELHTYKVQRIPPMAVVTCVFKWGHRKRVIQ